MPKPHFLVFAVVVLLASCFNNKQKAIQTAPAFKQSPLDSAYAAIRPAIQTFTINNSKVTRIKATNGTEVLIPAGCLVTANGEPVENAQLEIVEAFTLPGFVTSGLATQSNGKLLISNGMVYINAKAGNENLRLKEGTSLTVSMPTMTNPDGFQLFTGDGSNWTPDSSMTEPDYIMPLPLHLLYPDLKTSFWFCMEVPADSDNKTYHVLDTSIVDMHNKKYENTVIATEAFMGRYGYIMDMTTKMSYLTSQDYYFNGFQCGEQKFNYDIWKIYLDHPERPLAESDSIAKKTFIDYFNTNKDKIASFCEKVNVYARSFYFNWTDTNYYFDFRKHSLEEHFMSAVKDFPPHDTKPLKLINDHGVNLEAADVYDQLAAKGVDKSEINQILEYHFRQKRRIDQLKKLNEEIANEEKIHKLYESTLFTVKKLGWINCDRFYDDPEAGKAQIYVSNNSRNNLDYVDYSLVIPSLNVRLSAYPNNKGQFTFTKEEGAYIKLPLGKEAVITGVSLQHDSLFYASRKIKIADGLNVAFALNYIKTNNLKDSLQAALSN